MGKLKRAAVEDDPGAERRAMVDCNRLTAPIAAFSTDILTFPPLMESEKLRLAAKEYIAEARQDGLSWQAVRDALRTWAAEQQTPVQEAYGLPTPGLGQWPLSEWLR